jgi:acyl-CoA thioesterase-1
MPAVIMWPRRSQSYSYGTAAILVLRLTALILITVFLDCCSPVLESAAMDRPVKIVVLGDSLSAGYGLPWDAAFPVRLEQALKGKGIAVTIANAGVSGDTVSDGLRRLEWSVPEGTEAVIIELGVNDFEHGVDPNVTKAALAAILRRLKDRHIEVLLTGARVPPSMGQQEYARAFDAIYPELASTYSFIWYPNIVGGVAGNPRLLQIDGEHPNASGVNVIVEHILPQVEELIARVRKARGS